MAYSSYQKSTVQTNLLFVLFCHEWESVLNMLFLGYFLGYFLGWLVVWNIFYFFTHWE